MVKNSCFLGVVYKSGYRFCQWSGWDAEPQGLLNLSTIIFWEIYSLMMLKCSKESLAKPIGLTYKKLNQSK